jgi:hypothetical protein
MSDDEKPKLTLVNKNKAKRVGLSKKLRYEVFKKDNFKCVYCGAKPSDEGVILEVDHVLPVFEGGTNDIENLVTSCKKCNIGKGKTKLSDKNFSSLKKAEHDAIDEKVDIMKAFVKSRMNKLREIEPALEYLENTMNKWKNLREDKKERVCTEEYKNKILILYKQTSMEDLIEAIEKCEVVFSNVYLDDLPTSSYRNFALPSNEITAHYLNSVSEYLEKKLKLKNEKKKKEKQLDNPTDCSKYLVAIIKNRTTGYGKWEVSTDIRHIVSKYSTFEIKMNLLNKLLMPMAKNIKQDSDYVDFYNEMVEQITVWSKYLGEDNAQSES